MSGTAFEPISGDIVIAAPQASDGATINFNFDGSNTLSQRLPREPFTTVPFLKDQDFIERSDVSALLRDKCGQPGSRTALVGLGGVGKSQLAIQYAYQVQQQSPATYVFWVHASTRSRFEHAYYDLANRLQLPGRSDPKTDVLQLVNNWLSTETNGTWFMIIDNADDIDVFYPKSYNRDATALLTQLPLASYIPQCNNGRILVTSRNSKVAEKLTGGSQNIISIPVMNDDQAKQLLRTKLGDKYDKEVATDLVNILECMPLAIMQAAAYILRPTSQTSPSEYLQKFRKSDKKKANLLNKDIGDLRRDPSAANSVVMTWQITFEQIQQERPSAAELLLFTSFLNSQGIPLWLLQSCKRRHQAESACSEDDSDNENDEFDQDMEILCEYSLIAATTKRGVYQMHALVQFCTRVWLSSVDNVEKWKCLYLEVMARKYPIATFRNWIKCQELDPHVERALELEPRGEKETKDLARLLTNTASFKIQMGRYAEAKENLEKAINMKKKVSDNEDLDTLRSANLLASVYGAQSKYEEAEQMARQALHRNEKLLGEEHSETLRSMEILAQALHNRNNNDAAEEISRRALNGAKKVFGAEHPDTFRSIGILAVVLLKQKKYEEAEQMSQRVLDGCKKSLGEEHPYTIISIINLSNVLLRQGKYDEAERMIRRALDSSRNIVGEEHPDTLASLGMLAEILKYQGKCGEAEQLSRQAVDGFEKVLGKTHRFTLHTMSVLVDVLRDQGKHDEVEQMNRGLLDSYKKVLSEEHPITRERAKIIANILQDRGKNDDAEQMSRQTLSNSGDAL